MTIIIILIAIIAVIWLCTSRSREGLTDQNKKCCCEVCVIGGKCDRPYMTTSKDCFGGQEGMTVESCLPISRCK